MNVKHSDYKKPFKHIGGDTLKRLMLITFFSVLLVSCENFLEVDLPKSRIVSPTVYKDDATAIAAVSGIYHQLTNNDGFAGGSYNSVTLLSGLSSDELINYYDQSDAFNEFYVNDLTSQQTFNTVLWTSCFEAIYAANAVVEGVTTSSSLKASTRTQLEGEARFIRAFSYFYLVNLFGNVPFITSTDYRVNRTASRTPVSEVYNKIVDDLLNAKELLNEEYVSVEKVRPNKAAATALLARTYLFMKDWANAEIQASEIIEGGQYGLETDLNNTFLANSNEAIWQMMDPVYLIATKESTLFALVASPNSDQPAAINISVIDSFEPGDLRMANWVGSFDDGANVYYFPRKYKNLFHEGLTGNPEYSMVLRLAEQFLIRAEARAQQEDLTGAVSDLDAIRNRAQIPLMADINPGISQANLLLAIEQERKVELFTEWGHRWLDLKRTDRANAVLNTKPNWSKDDALYPVPEREILNDPNLKPQNPGY